MPLMLQLDAHVWRHPDGQLWFCDTAKTDVLEVRDQGEWEYLGVTPLPLWPSNQHMKREDARNAT